MYVVSDKAGAIIPAIFDHSNLEDPRLDHNPNRSLCRDYETRSERHNMPT